MNLTHAQQVAEIESAMSAYATPEIRTRIPDEELTGILHRRAGDAAGSMGDVMLAMGYRDWYARFSHPDVNAARANWRELLPDGKFQRLKWFAGMVERWSR